MEKSIYINQSRKTRATTIATAILLGISSFVYFIQLFKIKILTNGWTGFDIIGGFINTYNQICDTLGSSSYILLDKVNGAAEGNIDFIVILLFLFMTFAYFIVKSKNLWLALVYFIPLVIVPPITGLSGGVIAIGIYVIALFCLTLGAFKGDSISCSSIGFLLMVGIVTLGIFTLSQADRLALGGQEKSFNNENEVMREYGDKEALSVKMENPQSLYLRGFIGDSFDQSHWKTLSPSDYYDILSLIKGLNAMDFNGLGQLTQAAHEAGERVENSKIDVCVKRANGDFAYLPYEVTQSDIPKWKNWGNSFLTANALVSNRYEYSVSENLTGRWTSLVGKLFSAKGKANGDYFKCESYINVDAYKKYTKLDDETINTLYEEIGTRGNQSKGHIDYKVAISRVRDYLDENYIFTENRIKESNANYLKELFKYKKGNDIDYATLSTLMFRYYGIPARYVSGYIISLDDEKNMKAGQEYSVPSNNEHCWSEIYVDGLGWVPIEACEKYYGVMKDADVSRGLESVSNTNPFNSKENLGKGESAKEVITDTENRVSLDKLLYYLVMLILLSLIIYVLWRLGKVAYKTMRRHKAFNQANTQKAICALYSYAKSKGFKLLEEIEGIGIEAAYSRHIMNREKLSVFKEGVKNAKKASKRKYIVAFINNCTGVVNRLRRSKH